LARLVVGSSAGLVDTVQFHPSYAYEDFVAGVAPKLVEGGLSYDIKPGLFHDFCQMAAGVAGAPCVLVIDEINRADLSRVFGELLMALEYRGRTVRLANGPGDGRFSVPKNVFVIGTMNTADRSIALFDHALRRRFSFVRIDPDYALLRRRLERDGLEAKPLLDLIEDLNAEIRDPNHFVGISFFMGDGKELPEAMEQIWDGEVMAYVREFFWEQPEVAERYAWDAVRRGALQSWYPAAAAGAADPLTSGPADTATPRG
jgi:5-methylcytosine-specific restriction protein B